MQLVAALEPESPELRADLHEAAGKALEALKRFGTALRDEIEPASDPHAFAVGEDQFSRRLHHEHALTAGAPELWRYGLHLQEETEAELAALAERMGARPWRELVEELRGDAPDLDALLPVYRAELDRAHAFVAERELVSIPHDPVDVVPTPAFLVALVPFAAYEPPPIFLSEQTGRFYVTQPDASAPPEVRARQRRGHCRHAIPAMVAHEAYPGHHLQLVTAQGLASEVRRHIWTPVMVEGWALYCEQLMDESGYYGEEHARLFRMVNLLWRAIRIVLDVGLHTRGMAPAEAVDYMVEHLPIERASAEAEVRRYCAYPTYQLCYAVGRRELLRLRDAYRERAGAIVPAEDVPRRAAGVRRTAGVAGALGHGAGGGVKITVLTYLDDGENSKEYDPVVRQVARTLRKLGHRVSVLGVHGDVKRLIAGLSRRKPDLVFNLMEMFGDERLRRHPGGRPARPARRATTPAAAPASCT